MITVKNLYVGNEVESYCLCGLTGGMNIITSVENHVGKTIVMQSIMYALGADPLFPPSFKDKSYLFIVDVDFDGHALSFLRNKNLFVVKDGETISPFEGKGSFDKYWSETIERIPSVVKDGRPVCVGLPLFTQMAFVPQSKRDTSRVIGSYFNRDDFIEMIYSLAGLESRHIDTKEEAALKARRDVLRTKRKELIRKAKALKAPGSSLAAVSPTADRLERERIVKQLDEITAKISKLRNKRNHAYARQKKNEIVLSELRSLNNTISAGDIVCLRCGSNQIGYRVPESSYVFDVTTSDMRTQIMMTVSAKIDAYVNEIRQLDSEIRLLQRKFNALSESQELTLEDVFAARDGYQDIEEIDQELSEVNDEIDSITDQLEQARQVTSELKEERKRFMGRILDAMSSVRRTINDDPDSAEYDSLFSTSVNAYSGSEVTEYYLARVYALAKHVHHGLPILIDSFRAEELSSRREERALPLLAELPNQVILTATLKGEEQGKYRGREGFNHVDFTGYTVNKLLSTKDNDIFAQKVEEFGLVLDCSSIHPSRTFATAIDDADIVNIASAVDLPSVDLPRLYKRGGRSALNLPTVDSSVRVEVKVDGGRVRQDSRTSTDCESVGIEGQAGITGSLAYKSIKNKRRWKRKR